MGHSLSSGQRASGALIVWPSLRIGTFGLIACICAALVGTEVWQLWQVYEANIRETEVVTSGTARSMAEQAETTLKTADTIAASLVERVEAEGVGPESRARFYRLMTSLAAALPAIHEMGIIDSHGDAIVKSLVPDPSGLNYADREYFRFHAAHPEHVAFIGARVKSKVDGTYNVTVTHRFDRPDGSFAGVVVTSVSMKFFQQLFDQMQAKSGGVIALLADDDTILARSPMLPDEIGAVAGGSELRPYMRDHPGTGSLIYLSSIDGVRRLGSYQHLSQYPLSTLMSQSEWDLQGSWRAELRTHAIILVCVMVVVAVLGSRAVSASRLLNAQAMRDSLTGLANRRFFDATIEREFRRAARTGRPISIIMIDIDYFKDYNDCYGHPAGDECLRAIARTVEDCVSREGAIAARYGGEEIAVILPGSGQPQAYAVAERMRLAVRSLAMRHARQRGGIVTLSAGVATCAPRRNAGGWQVLVDDADAALYAAKTGGRDNVQTSPPSAAMIGCDHTQLGFTLMQG